MTNKITMQLEVLANAKQAEATAKKLKKDFQDAVNPTVNAPRGAMKQASMPATSMQGVMDSRDSNMSRGLGGLTGAEGRDFAKQAQGLGGLVHIYATFAANIFALSAAFTALSKAADTTNMIKGLDQLGASSGRALGSLSKQLVAVTDGAISLREAMTATALASSGGMSNQAILRMGEVAKQASQALGVAMPDAISRLSRGITKLEPELLDEIGIMVRVDRTSQDYAASIGKSAAALTDFEKRQAFANAVLEQGEKKFGAIKIDANPYSKILASMQNIAQTGLELVNKVLSPILTILSSSPTALATAMAGIAAILIKQAVPAIGSFKESLRASAENSTRLSNLRSIEARKANIAEIQNARDTAEGIAEVKVAAINKEVAAREAILAKSKFREGSKIAEIFDKPTQDITAKDYTKIETEAKKALTKGNIELAASYRAGAAALRESAAAEIAYSKVVEKTTQDLISKQKITSTSGQFQRSVDRDNQASISRNITSRAAETAATNSFGKAWKDASEEVRKAKMGPQIISIADAMGNVTKQSVPAMGAMQGFWTMTKVGAVSAISAIGTALNAFMGWIAVIGFVVAGIGALVSWMSTSEKQSEKFSTALTGLNDAAENASKTIEALSTKTFAETLDPKAIQARATAFLEVSDSVNKTAQSYRDLLNAQSGMDKFVEGFFSFFGKGDSDKLSKSLGITISNSLELLSTNPEAKKAAESALNNLFGKDVDIQSPQALIRAMKAMDEGKLAETANAVSALFKKVSNDVNNAASNLTTFTEGLAATAKLVGESNAKLLPQDENGKFGANLINQGLLLSKVLEEGPIHSLAAMNSLIADTKSLSLLPEDTRKQLIDASAGLTEIQNKLGENNKRQIQAEKALAKAIEDRNAKFKSNAADTGFYADQNKQLLEAVSSQEDVVAELKKESAQLSVNASKAVSVASDGLTAAIFDAGAKRLTLSLESAMVSAAVVAGGAYLSVLKGIGGDTAVEEGKLRMVEIEQQRSVVKATYANVQAITSLELTIRQNAAEAKREKAVSMGGGNLEGRNTAINAADKELAAIQRERDIVNQKDPAKSLAKLSSKDTTKEDRDAFAAQSGFVQSLIAYKGQMAALDAKAYASRVTQMAAEEGERVKNQQREYDDTLKTMSIKKSNLDLAQKVSGNYSEGITTASYLLEKDIALNESLKSQEEIQGKINIAKKLGNKPEAIEALNRAQNDMQKSQLSLTQKNKELDAKYLADKLAGEMSLAKLAEERASVERNNLYNSKVIGLEIQEQSLKYSKDIGDIDAETATKALAGLALEKQELGYKKELAELASKEKTDLAEKQGILDRINAANAAMPAEGDTSTWIDPKEQQAALDAAKKSYADQKANIDARNGSIVNGIKLTSEHTAMMDAQAASLKAAQSSTESLTALFGEMGTNIGKVGEALTSAANSMELMAKRREELYKDGPVDEDSDKYKKYLKDKTNAEITSITNIAGANKKLFKEKSAGYKMLDAVEKAGHAYRVGLQLQETAIKIKNWVTETAAKQGTEAANTASTIAGFMSRAGAYAAEIYGKTIGTLGPIAGPVVATGLVAAMLALVGGSSSGGSSVSIPSVEDQQKASGTGQSYNSNGELVTNGGGALGDASAKSTAIVDGIEKLATINYEMLQFSQNRTYDALVAIRDNTEGFVKATGARLGASGTNSLFDTKEGTSGPKGLAGGVDSLLGSIGLGGLFGETVDRKVQDQGITVKGTLGALTEGGGTKQIYENIRDEWSSFLDSGVNEFTQTKKLDAKVDEYIVGIFKGFNDVLISAAESLGSTSAQVSGILSATDINLKVSSKGLTGAEYAAAIMSEVGIQLDIAANKAFPELASLKTKFQELGETNTDFIIRLINSSEQVGYAFESIGKSLGSLAGLDLTKVSLGLEKAAGGLDNFISLTNAFGDAFLTEAERLAPVTKAVATEIVRLDKAFPGLGIKATDTREEFKNLVMGWTDFSEKGQEGYVALLQLSDAFDKVVPAIDNVNKVLSETELLSAKSSQALKILELLGKKEELLAATRAKELEAMDARLVPTQNYIYALEDEAKAKAALVAEYDKQINATKSLISSLKTSISTTVQYKNSLLQGDKSILDPSQKYAQAKSEAEKLAAIIASPANTAEQKATRADAIAKLPAVGDALLTASKTLFASSSQYTADFESVTRFLDGLESVLNTEESTAVTQLNTLNKSRDFLEVIADSTSGLEFLTAKYYATIIAREKAEVASAAALSAAAASTGTSGTGAVTTSTLAPAIVIAADLSASKAIDEAVSASGSLSNALTEFVGPPTPTSRTGTGTTTETLSNEDYYSYYGGMQYSGTKVQQFAKGGLASGIALVGEEGPELVDFKTPGRVYPSAASNQMLNNKELIEEIKNLRKEVSQLRAEQKEQTGHLISTTYDASVKSSNAITSTFIEANENAQWNTRSVVNIR